MTMGQWDFPIFRSARAFLFQISRPIHFSTYHNFPWKSPFSYGFPMASFPFSTCPGTWRRRQNMGIPPGPAGADGMAGLKLRTTKMWGYVLYISYTYYYIISYFILSYYSISYYIISHYIIYILLYYIISYYIISYYIISYCIILYYIILYYITLY